MSANEPHHDPYEEFNMEIPEDTFPEEPISARAAQAIVESAMWTDANPMLKQVRWGRAELVSWMSGDGHTLQGKLVKPAKSVCFKQAAITQQPFLQQGVINPA